MSRAQDILAALRLLPSPLVGTAVYSLARDAADREDKAIARALRAEGRASHADETTAAAYRAHAALVHDVYNMMVERDAANEQIAKMALRIEQLEEVERNGLADDERATFNAEILHNVRATLGAVGDIGTCERARFVVDEWSAATRERNDLRTRCADLAKKSTDQGLLILALEQSERDAARVIAELNGQIESMRLHNARLVAGIAVAAAEPVKVAEVCAWCLGSVGESYFGVYLKEPEFGGSENEPWIPVCVADGRAAYHPSSHDIRARVATRAASCASRRTSADPLAKACETCMAPVGAACDLTAYQNEAAS